MQNPLRGALPPHREGPPLHIHHCEHEEGEITAGTLSAEVGGKVVEVAAGERVRLPMGGAHRWWNAADQPLALNGQARPLVDLDRYLQAVFEVMNAGPPNRPPLCYLAHAALRHRRTQSVLVMPVVIQALLFRVVVAVGTLLGRSAGRYSTSDPTGSSSSPFSSPAAGASPGAAGAAEAFLRRGRMS